jgi:DNA-binding transcriptional LysR family regulator
MADEAGRLAEEAKRLASGKGGLVRIGVSPVPSRIMFPDIVISIANQFPSISLDVLSALTSQLAEGLVEREFDMIVCPALDGDHPEIASELLLETDIIVVARPGHPLCTDPPATIKGLFKFPIALPVTEKHYLDTVKREFGIDIENMPGRILCSDPSMLARIVQKSERLFTAAPRFYFSPEIEAGLLHIVATPVPMGHTLYLHWNRDAFPLPALQRAREAIRNAFASL